ncbi:cation diffusion facilitator family transporter [Isachenkonia alkalipeptolytica]|nr:cation diffusion facilitator family transporter [Isachenkonia alkalipeptolytica]
MEKNDAKIQEINKVTLVGIFVNFLLSGIKIFAGLFGNSSALFADGLHSLSDFSTDIVAYLGARLGSKPPDDYHNYGYGKYETLATLFIALFLGFVALQIFIDSFQTILSLLRGDILQTPSWWAFFAALASILLNEGLFRYALAVGKRINSNSIIANAWHHRSDGWTSIAALIGVGGAIFLGGQWVILDPVAAILVSVLVLKVAIHIFLPAIRELLDFTLHPKELEQIYSIIEKYEEILDYHKLRSRKAGGRIVLEFHIVLKGELSLKKSHDIADALEKELKDFFGEQAIVTIHIEPPS